MAARRAHVRAASGVALLCAVLVVPTAVTAKIPTECTWNVTGGADGVLKSCTSPIQGDTLDLSSSGITFIEPHAFDGVNVRNLKLFDNPITALGPWSLGGVTAETLTMHACMSMTDIHGSAFHSARFGTVYMDTGGVVNIHKHAFRNATVENELDLMFNPLGTLPQGAFTGLKAKQIFFDSEKAIPSITSIEAGAFDGAIVTSTISLVGSNFTTLAAGTFTGLAGGCELLLEHCPALTSLATGFLSSGQQTEPGIRSVRISANPKLAVIAQGAFGSEMFEHISIADNALTALETKVFQGLHVSGNITIAEPLLKTIRVGSFEDARLGDYLKVHGPALSAVHTGAFKGAQIARGLLLENNPSLTQSGLYPQAFDQIDMPMESLLSLGNNSAMASLDPLTFAGTGTIAGTVSLSASVTYLPWTLLGNATLFTRTTRLVAPGMMGLPCEAAGRAHEHWMHETVCTDCPPGNYCPGTHRPEASKPVPCPNGTGTMLHGAADVSACKPCSVAPGQNVGGNAHCTVVDGSGSGSQSHGGSQSGSGSHHGGGSGSHHGGGSGSHHGGGSGSHHGGGSGSHHGGGSGSHHGGGDSASGHHNIGPHGSGSGPSDGGGGGLGGGVIFAIIFSVTLVAGASVFLYFRKCRVKDKYLSMSQTESQTGTFRGGYRPPTDFASGSNAFGSSV